MISGRYGRRVYGDYIAVFKQPAELAFARAERKHSFFANKRVVAEDVHVERLQKLYVMLARPAAADNAYLEVEELAYVLLSFVPAAGFDRFV